MAENEKKVSSTDTNPASALGVGESVTPQGNQAALGETEEERREGREAAGVDSGQPVDESMPNLRPGDQAG